MNEPLARIDLSPTALFTAPSALAFHPARESLFNELHARPFPVLQTPSCLAHLVLLREEPSNSAEHRHLHTLCAQHGVL
ncbi:MAG: DUF3422 family protein, partial [Pseudomonas sp.]|nr:DUF3422 family protein [Pseudomonas sp.]